MCLPRLRIEEKDERVYAAVRWKLAPDGFFDVMRGAFIIFGERLDRFTGLIPFGNDSRGNARPYKDRTAKGHIGINGHNLGLIGLAGTGKEVEFHRDASRITLNTAEIHAQDGAAWPVVHPGRY